MKDKKRQALQFFGKDSGLSKQQIRKKTIRSADVQNHYQVKVIPPFNKSGIELYPLTSKNFLLVMFCASAKSFK